MDLGTFKTYIIHLESVDPGSNLVSSRDLDSWNTLLRAARLRQHTPLLDIATTLSVAKNTNCVLSQKMSTDLYCTV